ncbi:unnamed protein product [Trichobilharzia szidati]|nr:unnamed protein product [Trichobilharzia szidati]
MLKELPLSAHPPCGFTVIALTFSNPIVAWFLCTSTGRPRAVAKYIHQVVGILSQMLAIPTIMIGFQMPSLGARFCSSHIYSSIFIISVIINVIMEVIFEVIGYKIRRNARIVQSVLSAEANEADKLLARIAEDPKHDVMYLGRHSSEYTSLKNLRNIPREITQNHNLWIVKYFLLAVHLAITFSLIFVLVVLFAS